MRVLILHMRFHPDLTGTGPLVTDLAAHLAASGDPVTVVTSMPHYGRRKIPPRYGRRLLVQEDFQGVRVWRTWVYVPQSARGFHRGLNYLSYTFMSTGAGILSPRPDVVLCVNPPITVGLSGWLLSVGRAIPMIFNVQDIWPDCIVIVGQLKNPLLIRVFKHLERLIYRVSARVTVLSEGMKANLVRKGVGADKVCIIPNWADTEHIQPVSKENGFRSRHGLNGRFVVMFAGNIGFNAVLDSVLDTADLMKGDGRVVFVIVGEGNAKTALQRRAHALRLPNVIFLPTQPKEELSRVLGSADLSLVTLNRQLGELNVPSKTYSIMASARPILAAVPDNSDIAGLLDAAGCGERVPPEDPASMARAIEKLSEAPELLRRYGENGRRHVTVHHAKPVLMERYRRLLQEVAAQAV